MSTFVSATIAKPLGIAAQLSLYLVARPFERDVRFGRTMMRLQDDTVRDRSDDIADEVVVRAWADRHVGRDGARKIFLSQGLHASDRLVPQRIPDFDLMARHPYVHLN
jgi:hypothetical protein